jgi:hypothetical protein
MNISSEEASHSLKEIDATYQRSTTLQNYRHFAPHMFIWGVIWLIANTLSDFYPDRAGQIWPILSVLGVIVSLFSRARGRAVPAGAERSAASGYPRIEGWRWALCAAVLFGFFTATFAVLPAHSELQATAFISLFFMFAYMIFGALAGLRVFAVGLVATLAILYGYFSLAQHQFLWFGVCAGGALIVGALWIRKA